MILLDRKCDIEIAQVLSFLGFADFSKGLRYYIIGK